VKLIEHVLWECPDCDIAESIPHVSLNRVEAFDCDDWEGVDGVDDGVDAGEGDVCGIRDYGGSRCVENRGCGGGFQRWRSRIGGGGRPSLGHSTFR